MAATGSNGWFADSFTYGIGGAGYDSPIPTRYQGTNAANPADWPGGVTWTTQLGDWAQTIENAFAQHNATYGTDYQFIPNLDALTTSWIARLVRQRQRCPLHRRRLPGELRRGHRHLRLDAVDGPRAEPDLQRQDRHHAAVSHVGPRHGRRATADRLLAGHLLAAQGRPDVPEHRLRRGRAILPGVSAQPGGRDHPAAERRVQLPVGRRVPPRFPERLRAGEPRLDHLHPEPGRDLPAGAGQRRRHA